MAVSTPAAAASSDAVRYSAMLNAERTSHGLAALTWRSDLATVAAHWAAQMAATDQLSHNPRLASEVTGWQAVGENVGEGPSISALATAFWDSSTHRANILDRSYQQVGVGSVRRDGVIWIAVDFRDPSRDATSSAPAMASSGPRGSSARPSTAAAPERLLALGSVGPAVVRAQRLLRVQADGIFGPLTQAAVRRFQRHHGLTVDGIIGPHTWATLDRVRG